MGPGTRASQKATSASRKPPQRGRGKKRAADESVVEDVQTPNKRAARPKGAPLVGTSHGQPFFASISFVLYQSLNRLLLAVTQMRPKAKMSLRYERLEHFYLTLPHSWRVCHSPVHERKDKSPSSQCSIKSEPPCGEWCLCACVPFPVSENLNPDHHVTSHKTSQNCPRC